MVSGVGISLLFLLALGAVILLGGIVVLVVLLFNPKTRVAGVVLLLIMLLVGAVGAAGLFVAVSGRRSQALRMRAVEMDHAIRQRMEAESRRLEAESERQAPVLEIGPDDQTRVTPGPDAVEEDETPGTAVETEATPPEEDAAETPPETEASAEETETAKGEPDSQDSKDSGASQPDAQPAPAEDQPAPQKPPGSETKPAAQGKPSSPPPAWVGAGPQQTADGYQISIVVGPYTKRSECDAAMPAELQTAVALYIADYLGSKAARRVRLAPVYIRQNVVQQEWEEAVENPLDPKVRVLLEPEEKGPLTQVHLRLLFDRRVNDRIDQQWKQAIVSERLWYVGTGMAALLAVLSVVFAGLKIDQSTDGTCRGRLCFAAAATILAVAGVAWFVLRAAQAPPPPMEMATPHVLPLEPISQAASAHGEGQRGLTALATHSPRWALALPVGGLILLVGLAGLVTLVFSERARAVALVVLAAALIGGLILVLLRTGLHMSVGPAEVLILAVATIYLLLVTWLSRNRWSWALGLIACIVVAVLLTPADLLSTLLVVVPLCVIYTIAVLAWKAGRKDPGTEPQG